MKRITQKLGLSLVGTIIGFSSLAADVEAGKAKAGICAACHGANGISAVPIYPNLAGQKEPYLAKQIKAFKAGERKDPTMAPMVNPLTDEDVANLAAYYASLPRWRLSSQPVNLLVSLSSAGLAISILIASFRIYQFGGGVVLFVCRINCLMLWLTCLVHFTRADFTLTING